MIPHISDTVLYIGADDKTLDLFESQYPVPNGISYNSYVILDEKVAVMDTVDARATDQWLANLKNVLSGRDVDYLVISHMEPDHAANIQLLAEMYPNLQLVGNMKTFAMMPQFFTMDTAKRQHLVKEGDTLSLGSHILQFFMAPMVHWPEVMVTYEQQEKILFSADGFGKFGALDTDEDWVDEARRYYINIVGKYGNSVQALLKKAASLDISTICPLHGPILKDNLSLYIEKYDIWSSYRPEESGILIAYASIHGNTAAAAKKLAELFQEKGEKNIIVRDLSRTDVSYSVADAFCYDRMVLACATYDGGLFPCMEDFLHHLKCKNFQSRTVGLIENGSWAPMAGKKMRNHLEAMNNITMLVPPMTIKSVMTAENIAQMNDLVSACLSK